MSEDDKPNVPETRLIILTMLVEHSEALQINSRNLVSMAKEIEDYVLSPPRVAQTAPHPKA